MVMVAVLATEVIGEFPCEYVALDVTVITFASERVHSESLALLIRAMIMIAFNLKPELLTVSFSATDNVPSNFPGRVTPVTVC